MGIPNPAAQRAIEELDASLPQRTIDPSALHVALEVFGALFRLARPKYEALKYNVLVTETAVEEWAKATHLDSPPLITLASDVVRGRVLDEIACAAGSAPPPTDQFALAFVTTPTERVPPPPPYVAMVEKKAADYLPWFDLGETKDHYRRRMDRVYSEAKRARGSWRDQPKIRRPALNRHAEWCVLHRVCDLSYEDIRRREPLTSTETIRVGVKRVEQALGLSPLPRRTNPKKT